MADGPLVIQTEHLDDAAGLWLSERCDLCRVPSDDPRFEELLPRASALVVRTYTTVDQPLLERAPQLRVVARAGVGLDNIDIPACRLRGVEVVYTPAANSQAVTELVLAFMLDAYRPRVFLDRALDAATWKQTRVELRAEHQLADLTLGVIGLGRVGTRVARAAMGLGMRVVATDLKPVPEAEELGVTVVPLADLLSACDIITVHIDGRAENHRFVDAQFLSQLQDDATLINTSRGFVVDPLALAAWLRDRPAARAMLDVHDPEPIEEHEPLLALPNAHLSPHIGAATATAQRNMSWVVRDVWRVLNNEAPEWPAP